MAIALSSSFTSDASKFFYHQEAMKNLRNGKGQPIVTHIMLTDICNHRCAMCSVHHRAKNALTMGQVRVYLNQLVPLGLKSVILSGGGNPILYKCPETDADFNDAVDMIHDEFGLEIGLITNGMPLSGFTSVHISDPPDTIGRKFWKGVPPSTIDKLTWLRISMSGLDHKERQVYVPDVDPAKTTLGFSYVFHDIYHAPHDKAHGKVSTLEDFERVEGKDAEMTAEMAVDRIPWLTEKIREYVQSYRPTYVRLLPNCLEPSKIKDRCDQLQGMANEIDPSVAFVQYKPPAAPKACYLGYVHPVLNSDGFVFPCDSVCLAAAQYSGVHKFDSPWAICKWNEIGEYFSKPVKSMVDSQKLCAGCVFTRSNEILGSIVEGGESPAPLQTPTHPNFV